MVGSLANTVKNTLLSLDLGIGKVGVNDPSKWTSKTTDDPNVSLAYNQETGQVILVQKIFIIINIKFYTISNSNNYSI